MFEGVRGAICPSWNPRLVTVAYLDNINSFLYLQEGSAGVRVDIRGGRLVLP
jgi:hypothetical protein